MLTPPAAIASNSTPAKVFSLIPGRSSATAAASPASATRIASRSAVDLLGCLDPPGGAHRQLTVDQLGVRERGRQQLRETR